MHQRAGNECPIRAESLARAGGNENAGCCDLYNPHFKNSDILIKSMHGHILKRHRCGAFIFNRYFGKDHLLFQPGGFPMSRRAVEADLAHHFIGMGPCVGYFAGWLPIHGFFRKIGTLRRRGGANPFTLPISQPRRSGQDHHSDHPETEQCSKAGSIHEQ